MQRELSTDNFKLVFKDKHTFEVAQDMLVNRKFEELENLLRVEWMAAQERAVILNKMYSEISSNNLRSGFDDEEY